MLAATIAAHRFGHAEASLAPLRDDPRGWVLAQFRQPQAMDGHGLIDSSQALALTGRVLRAALGAPEAASASAEPDARGPLDHDRQALRRANSLALERRWQQVVGTRTPVFERWVHFWANHFSVAATKGSTQALVWPFEREAIRPRVLGRFADLLRAATRHPAMLLYLDNAQSVDPRSRVGLRRERGLNENLARELLELHTLGVNGGYTQADVTELARLLTGWTVPRGDAAGVNPPAPSSAQDPAVAPSRFVPALHEPGSKRVLGRSYGAGPEALEALLLDLARHPATARHLATKLVRHFVADAPPSELVDVVAARFRDSDGDLLACAEALFGHDAAWRGDTAPKFKRPEELVLSAHRLLQRPIAAPDRLAAALLRMGQPVARAPSPQGWPDRSEDWLAPDALWKRLEWVQGHARGHAAAVDARQLAEDSFGADLAAQTRRQIAAADSAAQALALLLASPEFQRR